MVEKEQSGYEDEDASATSLSASEEESDAVDFSGEEEKAKPKKRGRPTKGDAAKVTAVSKGAKGAELWRPGVKTGLGPGTQVIVKKPKARETGSTPYTDDTIHPNTMLFLGDLAANNDREWLKSEHAAFIFAYTKTIYLSCTKTYLDNRPIEDETAVALTPVCSPPRREPSRSTALFRS